MAATADAEMRARFESFAATRDRTIRDELVAAHLPLARRLAERYRGRAEPLDDLVQVASLGLIKAVERYDPHRGSVFTAFAVPTILGELRRHFRDAGWYMAVPRRLKELRQRAPRTAQRLADELGRSPTTGEVASELGCDQETLMQAMSLSSVYRPDSLDRAAAAGEEDGDTTVVDMLGDSDPRLLDVEDRAHVRQLVSGVPDRQRRILHLYYYRGMSQREIGARLGVSQVHVSRILADSRKRMCEQAS